MHPGRAVRGVALLVVVFAMAGLVGDAIEGFPFTRSQPQPLVWFGALVLGGAISVTGEWALGWILEGDRTTDPLWMRTGRLGILGVALAVAVAIFVFAAQFFTHK